MRKDSGTPKRTSGQPSDADAPGTRRQRPYRPGRRPRFLTLAEGGASLTVMIAPLRGPDHLAVIHRWRYYHVPVSAISPVRTAVQFIAFYEAASGFSRPMGLIREYAPVRSVSRVVRRELPGLTWPGRRGEEAVYYRFDLGPLVLLPAPVGNPEGLRTVFRFADLERLRAVRTLRDLGGPGRLRTLPGAGNG